MKIILVLSLTVALSVTLKCYKENTWMEDPSLKIRKPEKQVYILLCWLSPILMKFFSWKSVDLARVSAPLWIKCLKTEQKSFGANIVAHQDLA